MFQAHAFTSPDDLLRSWSRVACCAWDPSEQFHAGMRIPAPHINRGRRDLFTPFFSDKRGMVTGDKALRHLPNGIVFEQTRHFRNDFLFSNYNKWIGNPDKQLSISRHIKTYHMRIGITDPDRGIIYGDEIPAADKAKMLNALAPIEHIFIDDTEMRLSCDTVTAASRALQLLIKLPPLYETFGHQDVKVQDDLSQETVPAIERDSLKETFSPLVDENGMITGITRPYFFTHNWYGLDVHGQFDTPVLRQAYERAMRRNKTADCVKYVTQWNLRPFIITDNGRQIGNIDVPSVHLAGRMHGTAAYQQIDRLVRHYNDVGLIGVDDITLVFRTLDDVNGVLQSIAALPAHDGKMDFLTAALAFKLAAEIENPTTYELDRKAANQQGTLIRGMGATKNSATPRMPPERDFD